MYNVLFLLLQLVLPYHDMPDTPLHNLTHVRVHCYVMCRLQTLHMLPTVEHHAFAVLRQFLQQVKMSVTGQSTAITASLPYVLHADGC